MKHLDDFDLSIVLPLCIPPEECRLLSLDMLPYYERNGIEVIIITMASHLGRKVTDYICNYPGVVTYIVCNLSPQMRSHSDYYNFDSITFVIGQHVQRQ